MNDDRARALLIELTALPTAAGREGAVVRFVRAWAKRRKRISLSEDAAGNLVLRAADERGGGADGAAPVWLVAHMDHPAAVVTGTEPDKPKRVHADFLGYVRVDSMKGAAMRLHRAAGGKPVRGVVMRAERGDGGPAPAPGERPDPRLTVAFGRDPGAQPGDVLSWDLGGSVVRGSRLHAPACDDLAGVAAALAVLDTVAGRRRPAGAAPLRVLLTRAEEVGFVGAISACRLGTIPADARVVVLEASKASPEAPIGDGPIVRVGDRTSTFDPALTGAVAAAAAGLAADDPGFEWQRKLMAGGTCEATAYAAFGYAATCVCLPLGNYHNMSDTEPDRLAREVISLRDFEGMCRLLAALPERLSNDAPADFRGRLETLHERRAGLLTEIPAERSE